MRGLSSNYSRIFTVVLVVKESNINVDAAVFPEMADRAVLKGHGLFYPENRSNRYHYNVAARAVQILYDLEI